MSSTTGGSLIQNLIAGGMAAPLAKLVANAIANANTGQLSKGADSVDSTPALAMRMIDADARRYQFPNLDYSPDKPYQDTLGSSPVQYEDATSTHPYQDAQPVQSTPPLAQPAIKGGAYVDAVQGVESNASQTTINLRVKQGDGTHLRLNPATNSVEATPLTFSFPQGIIAASVAETDAATVITLSVPNQTLLDILTAYARPAFQCRAWAHFSGYKDTTGATVATGNRFIKGSGNVAYITRQPGGPAAGVYFIYFTKPMNTTNYTVLITVPIESVTLTARTHPANTTDYCWAVVSDAAQTGFRDAEDIHVAVFE